jgi:uncharacterized protein YkwD
MARINGNRLLFAIIPALLLVGCGISLPTVRTPTRPDGLIGGGASSDDALDNDDIQGTAATCVDLGPPADANQLDMLSQLNAYREANGLGRVRYSRTLEQAAQDYARRLYREDFFDHEAPDGSQPSDRALDAGFCNRFVGENLAYGLNSVATAAEAMDGFKNSPGHNENMLRARWNYVGIGFLAIPSVEGTEYWWVQLFGDVDE